MPPPPTICLGVAIDHRIRRLFRPISFQRPKERSSEHVVMIQEQGQRFDLSESEIKVTAELAGPKTKGGIAVVLQQPRENHPYEEGTRAVVEDCETLKVLDILYRTVSCDTLNLIDLLPYVTEKKMRTLSDEALTESLTICTRAICNKEPDVVLCAGKVWLERSREHCKDIAWRLETRGIGETFNDYPEAVLYDKSNRGHVYVKRVNGFHPSHAINHHPERSCLIQLILLTVWQICHMFQDAWEETQWMTYLRIICRDLHKEQKTKLRYSSEFAHYYGGLTVKIRDIITEIADSYGEPYNGLLQTCISELFNDASLCLREIFRPKGTAKSKWAITKDDKVLEQTSKYTQSLIESSWDYGEGWFACPEIRTTIISGICRIGQCFSKQSENAAILDLQKASMIFLEIAEAIEMIL